MLVQDRLADLRRRFHRYPEPAWREFTTTALLVEELRQLDLDDLAIGPDAYDPADRMAVPTEDELAPWRERARENGVDADLLDEMAGGNTGCVAVVDRGGEPSIGVRVDIDGLFVEEATGDDHQPAREGFRSEHPGTMHACGHDAHMTLGLALLDSVIESDFPGRLVVFFQPAEEEAGGGKPMAESHYADDLDYLLAVHVGLGHPTGEFVGGIQAPLAMSHLTIDVHGESAHAGKAPNEGANAIQAAATGVEAIYGIPRHSDGMTRVNVGRIEGGTTSNVIADHVTMRGEVRGETTPLRDYAKAEFDRRFEHAAEIHGCTADVSVTAESPRADSDPDLAEFVYDVARQHADVDSPLVHADFGASEDATFLMQHVQDQGGLATYLIVGTDHPTAHHTSTFDVDERSLTIGADVLTDTVLDLATVDQDCTR